jgi:hypothetical protein
MFEELRAVRVKQDFEWILMIFRKSIRIIAIRSGVCKAFFAEARPMFEELRQSGKIIFLI